MTSTEREWSPSVLEALQAAAATLGAAIYRARRRRRSRESEERFRRLSESAFEGVFIHDNGVLLEGNAAIARIFGYRAGGVDRSERLRSGARHRSRAHDRASACAPARQEPYEITATRKDGSLVSAEITDRAAMYKGRPARVATVNDVTERQARRRRGSRRGRAACGSAGDRQGRQLGMGDCDERAPGSDEHVSHLRFRAERPLTPGSILATRPSLTTRSSCASHRRRGDSTARRSASITASCGAVGCAFGFTWKDASWRTRRGSRCASSARARTSPSGRRRKRPRGD